MRQFSVRGKRADEQRNFSACRFIRQRSSQFSKRTTPELFVDFGDFARQASRAIAKDFVRVDESFLDAMRRFIKNDGAILDAKPLERTSSFAATGRQESREKDFLGRQTRSRERCEQRGRPGNRNHGNVMA